MRHVVLLACLFLGLGAPALAQSQADRLDGLTAVIAENNCRALRAESDAIFSAAGYADPSEVQVMMFALVLSGRAMLDEQGMRLLDPGCPIEGFTAPDDTAVVDAYIAALEANDCEMPVTDAQAVLNPAGIANPNLAAQIAAALVAEGRLVALSDPYRMRVVTEACPAS